MGYLTPQARLKNDFVEELLTEAMMGIKSGGLWEHHYDYDGGGVFIKTTVRIQLLDQKRDLYNLELYAAYVGDEPEKGLAEQIGIPRNLLWSCVTVHIEQQDAMHFSFDFEQLLGKLGTVFPNMVLRGKDVASMFMNSDWTGDVKPVVIYGDKILEVSVAPGRIERRFVYEHHQKQDTWTINGAILGGLLDLSYEDKNRREPPTIVITVKSSKKDEFGSSCPIWDESQKKQVLEMTEQIAGALKP